nr:BCCT family transporter [Corynebacterium halotolerans]
MLSQPDVVEGQLERDDDTVILQSEAKDSPIQWAVVLPAAAIILAIVGWGLLAPESFSSFAAAGLNTVVTDFGWAFVLFSTVFVAFVLVVALSRFGTIKLGASDEAPEFRTISWIAMMFAAGMGIGLMFYGASEPLFFFRDGVPGYGTGDVSASMASAMFHWTLHPWALYAIVGLAIAYSTFRLGRKQLISSAFVPLIGEKRAEGWLGKLIDMLSIIATVFGTACSLGIGALQIGAGMDAAGIVEDPSMSVILGVVSVLTLAFILSALSGVGKGIQYISNFNIILAALLAIFVFILGPTVAVLDLIPGSIGAYMSQFFEMASRTGSSGGEETAAWLGSWTIFYWAWWTSWTPFVGMFLARISRGRSIREFLLGVLLIPSGVSTVWFAIMGGTAITLEREGHSIYGDGNAEEQLFAMLHELPGGYIAGIAAMVLLATFFITSADSASTVMGSLSQSGRSDANPWVSATWGVLTAAVGMTMLVTGGDDVLNNLQNVTITVTAPFLIILICLMVAIVKDLRNDVIYLDYRSQQEFAVKLARERRLHDKHLEQEERRARRQAVRARTTRGSRK